MRPNGLDLPLNSASAGDALHTLVLTSDGSLSPQRNQSFIAAVIGAIRHATTHSGKRLSLRSQAGKRQGQGSGAAQAHAAGMLHSNSNNNNNEHSALNGCNGGDDSDSTEMLDSETEVGNLPVCTELIINILRFVAALPVDDG